MTTIFLPYPPSANNLWRVFKCRIIRSADYRGWISNAGKVLNAQHPQKLTGPVTIHITANPPDKRRRDIDNLAKSTVDLLEAHQVIERDDMAIVRKLTLEAGELRRGDGRVVVTVENAE